MTETAITTALRLNIVKHLASGKGLDVVATIVGLPRQNVLDIAGHHGYPRVDRLNRAAEVLTRKIDEEASAELVDSGPLRRGTPLDKPTAVPAPARPVAAAPSPSPAAATGDTLREFVEHAQEHPSKRIQTAARRVLVDIDRLRALIAEDEKKNAAKRKAEAEKAKARAEVERLEQQLAEAKAKLRGSSPGPKTKKAEPSSTTPSAPGEHACQNEGCDRTFDSPQGRSMHQRMRCEHRPAVAS